MRSKFILRRNGRATPIRTRLLRTRITVEYLERRDVPSFITVPTYGTGDSVTDVVTADFNGDGAVDVAAANHSSGGGIGAAVLLNAGDGTFLPKTTYPTGKEPISVAVGDFNHDAAPDLAFASSVNNSVSVLINQGGGTFSPFFEYGTATAPSAVITADFNNDGNLDLALSNKTSPAGSVSLLLGNADGTFQDYRSFPAGKSPTALASGDLNGDGRLDLVVTDAIDGSVRILRGSGTGVFRRPVPFAAGPSPRSVAVGDVNGDGALDLAVVNDQYQNGQFNVLVNNGDATFGSPIMQSYGHEPTDVLIADFNSDGVTDLAIGDDGALGKIGIATGHGDGNFDFPISYVSGSSAQAVVASDVNGDGTADLIAANNFSIGILIGTGAGAYAAPLEAGAKGGVDSLGTGDFNDDGRPDLAALEDDHPNGTNGRVAILLNSGGGHFERVGSYPLNNDARQGVTGDFNGDGVLDLAMTLEDYPTGAIGVLLGNGDGTFAAPIEHPLDAYPISAAVGDLNGDGFNDVVFNNYIGVDVGVLISQGDGTFEPVEFFAAGAEPSRPLLGDVNDDGALDVVVTSANTAATVSVLLGNGDGTFAAPLSVFSGGIAAGAADFNADGNPDLVALLPAKVSKVHIVLGNGDGTFQAAISYDAGPAAYNAAIEDFDNDGVLDIAVSSSTSANFTGVPSLSVFLGRGDGTFKPAQTYLTANVGIYEMVAADFTGDGFIDLGAEHSGGEDDVAIYVNDSVWGPAPIDGGPGMDAISSIANQQGSETISPVSNEAGLDQVDDPESEQSAKAKLQTKPGVRVIRAIATHHVQRVDDMMMNWDI